MILIRPLLWFLFLPWTVGSIRQEWFQKRKSNVPKKMPSMMLKRSGLTWMLCLKVLFSDLDCAGVDVGHQPPKESDAARWSDSRFEPAPIARGYFFLDDNEEILSVCVRVGLGEVLLGVHTGVDVRSNIADDLKIVVLWDSTMTPGCVALRCVTLIRIKIYLHSEISHIGLRGRQYNRGKLWSWMAPEANYIEDWLNSTNTLTIPRSVYYSHITFHQYLVSSF